jgi:hypothetical protein
VQTVQLLGGLGQRPHVPAGSPGECGVEELPADTLAPVGESDRERAEQLLVAGGFEGDTADEPVVILGDEHVPAVDEVGEAAGGQPRFLDQCDDGRRVTVSGDADRRGQVQHTSPVAATGIRSAWAAAVAPHEPGPQEPSAVRVSNTSPSAPASASTV